MEINQNQQNYIKTPHKPNKETAPQDEAKGYLKTGILAGTGGALIGGVIAAIKPDTVMGGLTPRDITAKNLILDIPLKIDGLVKDKGIDPSSLVQQYNVFLNLFASDSKEIQRYLKLNSISEKLGEKSFRIQNLTHKIATKVLNIAEQGKGHSEIQNGRLIKAKEYFKKLEPKIIQYKEVYSKFMNKLTNSKHDYTKVQDWQKKAHAELLKILPADPKGYIKFAGVGATVAGIGTMLLNFAKEDMAIGKQKEKAELAQEKAREESKKTQKKT